MRCLLALVALVGLACVAAAPTPSDSCTCSSVTRLHGELDRLRAEMVAVREAMLERSRVKRPTSAQAEGPHAGTTPAHQQRHLLASNPGAVLGVGLQVRCGDLGAPLVAGAALLGEGRPPRLGLLWVVGGVGPVCRCASVCGGAAAPPAGGGVSGPCPCRCALAKPVSPSCTLPRPCVPSEICWEGSVLTSVGVTFLADTLVPPPCPLPIHVLSLPHRASPPPAHSIRGKL